MKKVLYLLVIVLFSFNCTADLDQEIQQQEDYQLNARAQKKSKKNNNKVTICHITGNGYITLEVNINALNAHIAHGDINPDKDGDGYTAANSEENPCGIGDATDCDDYNADVHPGAEEIYTDDIDNNCNGVVGTVELIEDYMPCTNCADGTSGDYMNPETRRCSDRKRRGYYHCSGTYEIYND